MGKCVSDEDSGSSLGDADIEDDRSYTSLYVMRITLVSSLVTVVCKSRGYTYRRHFLCSIVCCIYYTCTYTRFIMEIIVRMPKCISPRTDLDPRAVLHIL